MKYNNVIHTLAALLLGSALTLLGAVPAAAKPIPPAGLPKPDREDGVQIFNRDVFWLDISTLRNPDGATRPEVDLFNRLGVSLGLTWGEWRQATAMAAARRVGRLQNPRTDVRIHLTGLIPNGVYSVFYGTFAPDSVNPLCPNVERTLPLIAFHPRRQDPDPSSFIADSNGEARYHARVPGELLAASQFFYHVIYHFDGMTYHPLPNRGEFFTQGENCRSTYGEDSMRQLVILQSGFE
jgi:hypothetical protein